MDYFLNVEGQKTYFSLPKGWDVFCYQDNPPISGAADPLTEIKNALDDPIGSPKIEELARPGMEAVVLFDDLQRPTPAHLAVPEILTRLNKGGIPDERIF